MTKKITKKIISTIIPLIVMSCGVFNIKTNVNKIDNINSKSEEFYLNYKKDLLEKYHNKKDYNGDIDLKINTGLLNPNNKDKKVFSVASYGFDIKNVPTGNIVFQESYTMESNRSFEIVKQFRINDTSKRYTLYVKRGNDKDKNDKVTGNVNINSYDWFKNKDFRCNDEATEESILLNSNNQISIKLQGKKKSIFTVMIIEGGTAGYVRKRENPLGNHETNEKHLKANDFNIFDPNDPKSMENLKPYNGDIKINETMSSSSFNINGKNNLVFESEIIMLKFKDDSSANIFKNLYNATIVDHFDDTYAFKLDLSKSPVNNMANILKKFSNASVENIESIEFSSYNSMKTFLIFADFLTSYPDLIKSIEFSVFLDLKKANNPDYGVYGESSTNGVDHSNFFFKNWEKDLTNIFDLQKIATGKDVKVAIIDDGFNINHDYMKDSSGNSRYIKDETKVPLDFVKCEDDNITTSLKHRKIFDEWYIHFYGILLFQSLPNYLNPLGGSAYTLLLAILDSQNIRDCIVVNHGQYCASTGFGVQ